MENLYKKFPPERLAQALQIKHPNRICTNPLSKTKLSSAKLNIYYILKSSLIYKIHSTTTMNNVFFNKPSQDDSYIRELREKRIKSINELQEEWVMFTKEIREYEEELNKYETMMSK